MLFSRKSRRAEREPQKQAQIPRYKYLNTMMAATITSSSGNGPQQRTPRRNNRHTNQSINLQNDGNVAIQIASDEGVSVSRLEASHSIMASSTITAAATSSAVHPPPRVRLDRPMPEAEVDADSERQLHSDQSGQQPRTLPQHLDGHRDEADGSADGDQQGEGAHYGNDPTPLHQNKSFFKKGHQDEGQPSQSTTQTNQPIDEPIDESEHDRQSKEPKSQSQNVEEPIEPKPNSNEPSAVGESLEISQQQLGTSPKPKRRINQAFIEGDASNAFSHYRPVVPLSTLAGKNQSITLPKNGSKQKPGKRLRRDKRDHKRDRKSKSKRSEKQSKDESEGTSGSASSLMSDGVASQSIAQQARVDTHANQMAQSSSRSQDPIHLMLQTDDPILQNYLPQLTYLNDNYYSKVKPYRMGKRNLPLNQIEVILRRRAVIKRADAQKQATNYKGNAGDVGTRSSNGRYSPTPPPSVSHSRLPPSHNNTPSRRKLFPTQQHHSPTPSYRKHGNYDDDSTISSTTVASQQPGVQIQHSLEVSDHGEQPFISNSVPAASAIAISEIPKEEIVGDTSLGLKLTIMQGKVVIQKITPLDDGRASPAQLCGLISPGDIIIAVNGKSLINGTIHNPVGMDRIISVLKPLSQPMDEETKEYSREVRLRFMLGEGELLLREQEEREKRKLEDQERRKRLGLEGRGGSAGMDPAADLFGIGAFMGVDQHSGMPMFGHLDHHHHHTAEEVKEEKKQSLDENGLSVKVIATAVPEDEGEGAKVTPRGKVGQQAVSPIFSRARPTVQAQIAHQVQLDRQWIRNRNTSAFYTMNDKAPSLLRPPSPPPEHLHDLNVNPIDARKQRLERGTVTMATAKSLISVVESQDRGIEVFEDEDPMEVASRACGTASVRTGASRRRWHRGGTIFEEEEDVPSLAEASGASSINPNFDVSTIRSGDSGIEACDHRMLVELAANNESWKMNVLKRLKGYAEETEKESKSGLHRGSSSESSTKEEAAQTSLDSILFGGDVASMLRKKKQSLALPPGEMTSMLFDLMDLLESGLPNQIIMNKDETQLSAIPPFSPEKSISFARTNQERNIDAEEDAMKATDFLVNEALGTWLKSFRPLPWKQRRALWPSHQSGGMDGESFVSSRIDDNESLSLMSGMTSQTRSIEKKKGNLRELIEDMELDHETRRETCHLVTFYFTHKFSYSEASKSGGTLRTLSPEAEDEASALIDAYGSYLDIYKCLVLAGKLHSKVLVDKLVSVAKHDSQHRESVKALQRANTLLFYEPSMLSALLELLPSISMKQQSSGFDFVALLVSAYPDLQPWCVHEAADSSEHSSNFYLKYLSALLHHEDGNDAAKRDEALVKEWCSILCSIDEVDPTIAETLHQSFLRIASRDNHSSLLYHRDLPFLMDISVKVSEFGLALSLANEIMSSLKYCRNKDAMQDIIQHLDLISDKAIEGNEGEINTVLLGQVITFFNTISPCMEENNFEFNVVAELEKLLEKSYFQHQNNPQYSSKNIDACIATISENAPPDYSLQVLSKWDHTCTISSSLTSALHTSLIRGAREGVGSELSGSLLRIQRAREEGRRPIIENGMVSWGAHTDELNMNEDDEMGSFIWPSLLDGTLGIAK